MHCNLTVPLGLANVTNTLIPNASIPDGPLGPHGNLNFVISGNGAFLQITSSELPMNSSRRLTALSRHAHTPQNGDGSLHGRDMWMHGHWPHGHWPHGHLPHGHYPHGHAPVAAAVQQAADKVEEVHA